jgi:hypothetical protein
LTRSSSLVPALVAAALSVSVLYVMQASNPRLVVSWHGFLHTAIAQQFPVAQLPPENPFVAGEPLPYYWFYQMLAAGMSAALDIAPIRAFQVMILASLALTIVAGALIGRACFRSIGIGLLIAYLAVAGANPLGPFIAGAKHVLRQQPLLNGDPPAAVTEAVFVTNEMADRWLTHPLLGALYFASDWRRGQNLVWFLDISSRAPAIAMTVLLMLLFLRSGRTLVKAAGLVLVSGLLAAINPVMGLAIAGTQLGASVLVAAVNRLRPARAAHRSASMHLVVASAAVMAGAIGAAPTYYHLFTTGQGGMGFTPLRYAAMKWTAMALAFLPIAALALLGMRRAPARVSDGVTIVGLAGLCLLTAATLIDIDTVRHTEQGNEHNLVNAALCLLAVPAVAWIAGGRWRGVSHGVLVFLAFLPTTVLTLLAYLGSPALPIAFEGQTLVRLPREGPLNALYVWARQSTPPGAVFVADPREPVKMSGNVSEFPAFTSRALFVDQPGYMTDQHADAMFRRTLAIEAVTGGVLGDRERTRLQDLRRPVYLVTYHADRAATLDALKRQHGDPLFLRGFVAVFSIRPGDRS